MWGAMVIVVGAGCQPNREGDYVGTGEFLGEQVRMERGADGKFVSTKPKSSQQSTTVVVSKSTSEGLRFAFGSWCTLELGLSRDGLQARTAKPQQCKLGGELTDVTARADFTPSNDMTLTVGPSQVSGGTPHSYLFFKGKKK